MLYELHFHTHGALMQLAEDMVCGGGLMAGEYRVGVRVSEARQGRGSYKEQNCLICNCLLVFAFVYTYIHTNNNNLFKHTF